MPTPISFILSVLSTQGSPSRVTSSERDFHLRSVGIGPSNIHLDEDVGAAGFIAQTPFRSLSINGVICSAENVGILSFGNAALSDVASINGKQPVFTDGSAGFAADQNANGFTINNLPSATDGSSAVPLDQVTSLIEGNNDSSPYQRAVLQTMLFVQPLAPNNGDRYLVGLKTSDSLATGTDWAGRDGQIAEYFNGWQFFSPSTGWLVSSEANPGIQYRFSGGTWVASEFGSEHEAFASAISILTDPPATPAVKDRYLVGLDTGASAATGDWVGHNGEIAEWNGSQWVFFEPTVGSTIAVDDVPDGEYRYGDPLWIKKEYETSTASGFLSKVGKDIQFTELVQGRVIIGQAGDTPQAVPLSGPLSISESGVTSIANNSIGQNQIDFTAQFNNATGNTLAAGTIAIVNNLGNLQPVDVTLDLRERIVVVVAASIDNGVVGPCFIVPGGIMELFIGLIPGCAVYAGKAVSGGYTQDISAFVGSDDVIRIGYAETATRVIYNFKHLGTKDPEIIDYKLVDDVNGVAEVDITIDKTKVKRYDVLVDGRKNRPGATFDYTLDTVNNKILFNKTINDQSVVELVGRYR